MYAYVIVTPGQGSQRPGMLDAWLDAAPRCAELPADWSAAAGIDLLRASRDEPALTDTAVAQPLIVTAALLSLEALRSAVPVDGRILFAGHSVGELAAAAGAGFLTPATAVALARVRGEAMAAACARAATGMAAVMPAKRAGASDAEIVAAIAAAGLSLANHNGSHQFVAAGPADPLKAFVESPPPGIRALQLDVAGAFHTEAMASAVATFARALREAPVRPGSAGMLSNLDGAFVAGPDDLRQRLIRQITAAVR